VQRRRRWLMVVIAFKKTHKPFWPYAVFCINNYSN